MVLEVYMRYFGKIKKIRRGKLLSFRYSNEHFIFTPYTQTHSDISVYHHEQHTRVFHKSNNNNI